MLMSKAAAVPASRDAMSTELDIVVAVDVVGFGGDGLAVERKALAGACADRIIFRADTAAVVHYPAVESDESALVRAEFGGIGNVVLHTLQELSFYLAGAVVCGQGCADALGKNSLGEVRAHNLLNAGHIADMEEMLIEVCAKLNGADIDDVYNKGCR